MSAVIAAADARRSQKSVQIFEHRPRDETFHYNVLGSGGYTRVLEFRRTFARCIIIIIIIITCSA
jgi:hypothetical protein